MPQKPVCVVVGVGPGNGLALARAAAGRGYEIALIARDAGRLRHYQRLVPGCHAFACDATDASAVGKTCQRIHDKLGAVQTLVYNAGSGTWGTLEEVAPDDFEAAWRVNALGLLLAARAVAPAMVEAGHGNIAVIGAGAAWRGRANTVAFAAAKAAQRSVAQSMARHLGPKGIHVCYVVLDGVVDLPRTRVALPDKPDDFFMKPEDIASAVFDVVDQPPSAWTFELDLRPHAERW